jgi:hypothetical protein
VNQWLRSPCGDTSTQGILLVLGWISLFLNINKLTQQIKVGNTDRGFLKDFKNQFWTPNCHSPKEINQIINYYFNIIIGMKLVVH